MSNSHTSAPDSGLTGDSVVAGGAVRPARGGLVPAVPIICLTLEILMGHAFAPYTCDDGYNVGRNADNLSRGRGFEVNLGEPILTSLAPRLNGRSPWCRVAVVPIRSRGARTPDPAGRRYTVTRDVDPTPRREEACQHG